MKACFKVKSFLLIEISPKTIHNYKCDYIITIGRLILS